MSGGKKSTSISHRALDELVKFQTSIVTDIGAFKTEVIKAITEVSTKHNELAAHLAAVEGVTNNVAQFAASEIGKLGGTMQQQMNIVGQATNAIDLNVLALAELMKEVIGQITQVDVILKKFQTSVQSMFEHYHRAPLETVTSESRKAVWDGLSQALELAESEVAQVRADAEKWYQQMVASSFKAVRERLEKDDQERKAQEAAAAAEAEKKAAEVAEASAVEAELKKAAVDELSIAGHTSGGAGSPFPDGAEIFGG